jgi:hypothetical protein
MIWGPFDPVSCRRDFFAWGGIEMRPGGQAARPPEGPRAKGPIAPLRSMSARGAKPAEGGRGKQVPRGLSLKRLKKSPGPGPFLPMFSPSIRITSEKKEEGGYFERRV